MDRHARYGDPAAASLHPVGRLSRWRGAASRAHRVPPRGAGDPLAREELGRAGRHHLRESTLRSVVHDGACRQPSRRIPRNTLVNIPRELEGAYDACLALAQSHYENFPVASRLLPSELRPHIAAVYAFARTADDYADEPGYEVDQRLRLLQEWRQKLHDPSETSLEFLALHHTIAQFDLPVQ